jgi:hypothetical protein
MPEGRVGGMSAVSGDLPLDDEQVTRLADILAGRVAERVLDLLTSGVPRLPSPRSPSDGGRGCGAEAVLRRCGDFWTVGFAGSVTELGHRRGFEHLSRLLACPGTPIHVLALTVPPAPGDTQPASRFDAEVPLRREGGLGPVLDGQAKAAYRRRLADLAEELDEARETGNGRFDGILAERDLLVAELARAVGLYGRDRPAGHPAERARVAVTKALRSAIRHVGQHHPACADHLASSVRTGTFCCYSAPGAPTWRL